MTIDKKKPDHTPLREDIKKREDKFPTLPATDSPLPGGGYIQNQGGDWEDPPAPPRDDDE